MYQDRYVNIQTDLDTYPGLSFLDFFDGNLLRPRRAQSRIEKKESPATDFDDGPDYRPIFKCTFNYDCQCKFPIN